MNKLLISIACCTFIFGCNEKPKKTDRKAVTIIISADEGFKVADTSTYDLAKISFATYPLVDDTAEAYMTQYDFQTSDSLNTQWPYRIDYLLNAESLLGHHIYTDRNSAGCSSVYCINPALENTKLFTIWDAYNRIAYNMYVDSFTKVDMRCKDSTTSLDLLTNAMQSCLHKHQLRPIFYYKNTL